MSEKASATLSRNPLIFMGYAIKPYWIQMACAVVAVFVGSSCESLQPYVIKLLVDTLGAAKDIHGREFLDRALTIGLTFLALRIVIVSAWWCYQIAHIRISPRAEVSIRKNLFERLFNHSYAWFLDGYAGRTGQRIDNAARSFREMFELICHDLLYMGFRGLTILGLLFYTDLWLGLGMIGWICVNIPITSKFSSYTEKRAFGWITMCGAYTQRVVDICVNIFSVRSSGGAIIKERENCDAMADGIGKQHAGMIKLWRLSAATNTNINTLLYFILFTLGFWRWQAGKISIGDFAMTLSAGIVMVDVMETFSSRLQRFSQSFGNLREALEGLLDDLPPKPAKRPKFRSGKGAIEFSSISFSYLSGRPVLTNLLLTIAAGEKVALVGPSGAGKSTLISLLLGLWNAQQGSILVDGQNVAEIDRESLLRDMAVIPQDTSLFHRSLFENIAYGSGDATQASVEAAARAAHIHDFIMHLPEAYQTHVGERGLKLSGGQRQRIAVARAIHKNAPILLLDEATSALDSESEHAIQDALHRLMPNKTVLAIAHRLSTIAHMDRIVVLDAGRIVEQGSHAELLKLQGRYAKLWAMQSGGYLPEPEPEEWRS